MVVSGPYLVGRALPPAFGMEHFVVTDSASAVRGVDTLAALGVDFIKVHNWIPESAARVIAAEARRRHLVYAGHVALPRTPVQALALPELTITARTRPAGRIRRPQTTGCPAVVERVNTAATVLSSATSIRARSSRP